MSNKNRCEKAIEGKEIYDCETDMKEVKKQIKKIMEHKFDSLGDNGEKSVGALEVTRAETSLALWKQSFWVRLRLSTNVRLCRLGSRR